MKFMVGITTYDFEQAFVKLVIIQPNNSPYKAFHVLKEGGTRGGRGAYLGFYVGKCLEFQEYWWWSNQTTPLRKKKKKKNKVTMDAPMLINIKTNRYTYFFKWVLV
jgi:hypothetical protein